jgi:hypothetical protein
MRLLLLAPAITLLAACAGVQPPPGPDTDRTFTVTTAVPYQNAFRNINKRAIACFGQSGLGSINHSVQSDLDAVAQIGRIEIFPTGLLNAEAKGEQRSVVITVAARGDSSEVTTTAPSRRTAYAVHLGNIKAVGGETACNGL